MSVKIRLRRDGAKKRPFYHVVAADERRARNGRFIEELGYYNPIVPAGVESIVVLKDDRIKYWLSVGAQPTETAAYLLEKKGLFTRPARKTVAKPTPVVEAAPVAAPVVEAVAAPIAEATPAPAVEAAPVAEAEVAPVEATAAAEVATETPAEASA